MRLVGAACGRDSAKFLAGWPAHAALRLGLGADYVPPKPQGGLFDDVEAAGEDEDDTEAFQKPG